MPRVHLWGTVRPGPLGPTEGLPAACPLTWPCLDSDWGPQRGAHGPHERGAAAAGTGQADQPGSRREARPGRLRGPRWVTGLGGGLLCTPGSVPGRGTGPRRAGLWQEGRPGLGHRLLQGLWCWELGSPPNSRPGREGAPPGGGGSDGVSRVPWAQTEGLLPRQVGDQGD